MSPLVLAIICIPDFFEISSDNKTINGKFGRGYRYALYYLIDKFNYTLICRDLSATNYCASDNSCHGTLRQMQLGTIDYGGVFTYLQLLSSNLINLTLGPVVESTECYIMHSPEIQVEHDTIGIGTVLRSFGVIYWTLVISLLLLFSSLWPLITSPSISIGQLIQDVVSTFFDLFSSALGQNFVKIRQNHIIDCLICSSVIVFITLTIILNSAAYIYSISVKYDFIKMESLTDVAASQYSVSTIYGTCEQILSVPDIPILKSHGLTNRPTKLANLTNQALARAFAAERNVLITEWYNIARARILVNNEQINGTNGRQIYTSINPLFSVLSYSMITGSLEPELKVKMIRAAYAAFETGNWYNSRSSLFDMIGLYNQEPCFRCFESARPIEETIIAPLSLERFDTVFGLGAILISLTVVIFIIELIFFYLNSSIAV